MSWLRQRAFGIVTRTLDVFGGLDRVPAPAVAPMTKPLGLGRDAVRFVAAVPDALDQLVDDFQGLREEIRTQIEETREQVAVTKTQVEMTREQAEATKMVHEDAENLRAEVRELRAEISEIRERVPGLGRS